MKKILVLLGLILSLNNVFAYNVTIVESHYTNPGQNMDTIWYQVCVAMGYTPVIVQQTALDANTFFSTTDLLIISSGVIALPANRVTTIQQFAQTGKPVYIQTEYESTFDANQAFQTIVNNLGGTFAWGGTTAGTLAPMNELGTFATTNNVVAPLTYFWYGCYGIAGCNVMNMIQYDTLYYGFQFCPGSSSIGSISTTSDQDWVNTSTSLLFMQNILTHLINSSSLCTSSGSSPVIHLGNDTTLCNGQSLILNGTFPNSTYLWSTGATTSTISVNTTGSYSIAVTDSCGTGRDTIHVTFSPPPTVTTGPNDSICNGSYAQLSASGGTSYSWTPINTLNNPHIANPIATPTTTTVYTVTASIGNCNATATVTVVIRANAHASFTADTFTGCNILTVDFTNLSTNYDSSYWSFGDGNHSHNTNPSHTYGVGTYTVSLDVFNADGCNSDTTVFAYIVVIASPTINPHFTPSPSTGCEPMTVHFTNTTNVGTSWYWQFGDNYTDTARNPVHTYDTTGYFLVYLTVTDSTVCGVQTAQYTVWDTVNVSPINSFTASNMSGCTPDTITFTNTSTGANAYYWKFGDDSTSTAYSPAHIYTTAGQDTVTLISYGLAGCNDTTHLIVNITQAETVVSTFTASPLSGCVPVTVHFTNTSTNANHTLWNFGDTDTSSTINPVHTYSSPGTYVVKLYSINISPCGYVVDSSTSTIVVNAYAHDSFTVSTDSGCTPLTVTFNNLSTNATSYTWNFGDNSGPNSNTSPTHIYTTAGTDTVTLIGFGAGGCNDTIRYSPITIIGAPITVSSFTPTANLSACDSLTVQFTNGSSNAVSYLWKFGDGDSSNVTNPSHTYTTSGTFTVTLVAYDTTACGVATDTSRHQSQITINPTAHAAFPDSNFVGCNNLTISWGNLSTNAIGYKWYFGTGDSSLSGNPIYSYTNVGIYPVTLIAYGAGGCNDTLVSQDTVTIIDATIHSAFTADSISGCAPFTVQFTNNSVHGSTYLWVFGDGGTSTQTNPSHTYLDSGTFTVKLYTINNTNSPCGILKDSSLLNTTISVDTPFHPRSLFTVSPVSGCSPVIATFVDSSTNYNFEYWNFGDGNVDSIFSFQTQAHAYYAGTYTATLITAYFNKCNTAPDTMKVNITVDTCNLYIPNIFSPNSDGKNDMFNFEAAGFTNYHLEIFDRWGLKVFESNDNKVQWNGKVNNTGSESPDGTYYYIFSSIDYNSKPFQTHGYFTLIR